MSGGTETSTMDLNAAIENLNRVLEEDAVGARVVVSTDPLLTSAIDVTILEVTTRIPSYVRDGLPQVPHDRAGWVFLQFYVVPNLDADFLMARAPVFNTVDQHTTLLVARYQTAQTTPVPTLSWLTSEWGGPAEIELQPQSEKIPITYVTDLGRARQIITLTVPYLSTMVSTESVAGWFLTFASVFDTGLFRTVATSALNKVSILDEQAWLVALGLPRDIPPNTPECSNDYFALAYLIFLGVSGKSTDEATINETFSKRWSTFCVTANYHSDLVATFTREVYQKLKKGLEYTQLIRLLMPYIVANIESTGENQRPTLRAMYTQIDLLLSYAGLQALKLSYEFVQSDTSRVWLLPIICLQASAVERAWRLLQRRGGNLHRFCRLLGVTESAWDTDNYPDILYCVIEAAKYRNEASMQKFTNKRKTRTPTNLLDKMLKDTLIQEVTKEENLPLVVRNRLSNKGLKAPTPDAGNEAVITLMRELRNLQARLPAQRPIRQPRPRPPQAQPQPPANQPQQPAQRRARPAAEGPAGRDIAAPPADQANIPPGMDPGMAALGALHINEEEIEDEDENMAVEEDDDDFDEDE